MIVGLSQRQEQIVAWMREQGRPVLFSEITDKFGRWAPTHGEFNDMIRWNVVVARFPEAKPGDSGRQFWEIVE